MVNTSSLSGVTAASRFASSKFSNTSNDDDTKSSFSNSSDSGDQSETSSRTTNRADTSSLSDFDALSSEPTTQERILNTPTALDSLSSARSPQDNSLYNPADTMPSGAGAAGHVLAVRGYDMLVDNPALNKIYESTPSGWTGKMGFTPTAEKRLEDAGMQLVDNKTLPPGFISRAAGTTQGISSGTANNINGGLAEVAIADRYRAQGFEVDTQAKFDAEFNPIERAANKPGDRAVDVAVQSPHPSDPRLNEVVHIESKAFRVGNNNKDIKPNQLMHDVGMLENNRTLRATGAALERTGQWLRPVGMVVDAVSVGTAIYNDGGIGVETGRTVTGIAGGAGGGWAGASSGATLGAVWGSAVPIVGTAVGAVIGGVVGGLGGAAIGEQLAKGAFDTIKSWFN